MNPDSRKYISFLLLSVLTLFLTIRDAIPCEKSVKKLLHSSHTKENKQIVSSLKSFNEFQEFIKSIPHNEIRKEEIQILKKATLLVQGLNVLSKKRLDEFKNFLDFLLFVLTYGPLKTKSKQAFLIVSMQKIQSFFSEKEGHYHTFSEIYSHVKNNDSPILKFESPFFSDLLLKIETCISASKNQRFVKEFLGLLHKNSFIRLVSKEVRIQILSAVMISLHSALDRAKTLDDLERIITNLQTTFILDVFKHEQKALFSKTVLNRLEDILHKTKSFDAYLDVYQAALKYQRIKFLKKKDLNSFLYTMIKRLLKFPLNKKTLAFKKERALFLINDLLSINTLSDSEFDSLYKKISTFQ